MYFSAHCIPIHVSFAHSPQNNQPTKPGRNVRSTGKAHRFDAKSVAERAEDPTQHILTVIYASSIPFQDLSLPSQLPNLTPLLSDFQSCCRIDIKSDNPGSACKNTLLESLNVIVIVIVFLHHTSPPPLDQQTISQSRPDTRQPSTVSAPTTTFTQHKTSIFHHTTQQDARAAVQAGGQLKDRPQRGQAVGHHDAQVAADLRAVRDYRQGEDLYGT
jgi:hypothetical protein